MMPLITIAGVPLPEPSSYSGLTSTVVDSGRNTAAKMIGSVIREDIAKVEVKWKFLTVEQWANILKLFNVSQGGSFINPVTFFNQTTGDYDTRNMYVSDRSSSLFRRDPVTGEVIGWCDCSLSLIEV